MKFRKKPIVIDAEQFLPFADDMHKPQSNVPQVFIDLKNSKTGWSIQTLEGRYDVISGDWIIKGIKGEYYPCKEDIFKMTYEKVDD